MRVKKRDKHDDDILNFFDDEKYLNLFFFESSNTVGFLPDDHSLSFPDFVEEELEWLSNKDAFPAVEFDIFSDHVPSVIFDHHSPVSVLENNSSSSSSSSCNVNVKENASMSGAYGSLQVPVNYPVRARSKRRRRTAFAGLQSEKSVRVWGNQVKFKNTTKQGLALLSIPMTKVKRGATLVGGASIVDKTPQWRAGPTGPKTLCNACGVRYKSGRLLPEYRPANSPTFSADLHSNSHRKVLEMRKQRIVD
ncbi:hypothetical protein HAX54_047823 [Datura stramonium]|uniref:GATA-type domain-containing protein n=1 Tax=Datura stramonium TaxID=4076 RepID=A0ABS8SUR8_DATST|nr:hypothetical protein [Datura stramonium]